MDQFKKSRNLIIVRKLVRRKLRNETGSLLVANTSKYVRDRFSMAVSRNFCTNFCVLRLPWPPRTSWPYGSLINLYKNDVYKTRMAIYSQLRFQAIFVQIVAFWECLDLRGHHASLCEHPRKSGQLQNQKFVQKSCENEIAIYLGM